MTETTVAIRPPGRSFRTLAVITGLAVALAAGVLIGRVTAGGTDHAAKREFMFQINSLQSPNQHGHELNFFARYRYNADLAESELPNYLHLREVVIDRLTNGDFASNPFWETVNRNLCNELKAGFPITAITCELQTPGVDVRGNRYQPGWHSSIHTIGDIEPLAVPGPVSVPAPAVPVP